ncbi:MAG: NAD(P)/FAD-dependent oxidoreductase [Arachidicoccus sp.]|nr:NAD(P)/FAD-dependent oxidoreductase [Arachidicoccus sp.]
MQPDKKIIIVGSGFAGLKLARKLSKSNYHVTLIDFHNFHEFQPLFYQVASARLEPSSISFPLRKIFHGKKNIDIRIGRIEKIDIENKKIHTINCEYDYDYLVIATGCTNNYFGNKNIEKYAYPMKTTPQAIALRNKILLNFEESLHIPKEEKEPFLNIAIVGGGPTGVELAGALAEMKNIVLPKDYPSIDFSELNILLIEGSGATLGTMSKKSQEESQAYLEKMGVKIMLNTRVEDYDGKTIFLGGGKTLQTNTMIWAAGVMGNIPEGIPKETIVRGNRISVDEFHQVKGFPDVYAIGDISYMETTEWPKGHPQLANVANHQAVNLAENFIRLQKNQSLHAFTYKNPGTMATIGKRKAVVDLPKFHFKGMFAWLVWMFLHLMLILGVRSKFVIFLNWMFNYFTNDSTLRVILLPSKKQSLLGEEYEQLTS